MSKGPQLAKDFNTHLAEYRLYYKDKLAFPLTIIIAGGEMRVFDEGEENAFFDMLVTSPEACYMWRGSADIIGVTNFMQMSREVTVYNQHTNQVEEIQKYEPDLNFPWKQEDANAPKLNQYSEMKLLNYKNTHFDLIVHKDHPLLSHSPIEEPGECNIVTQNTTKNQTPTVTPNTTNESTNKAPYGETLVKKYPCAHCGNKFEDKTKYYHHCKTDHEDEYITVLEKKMKESKENVHILVKDLEEVKIKNKELKTIRKVPNLTSKFLLKITMMKKTNLSLTLREHFYMEKKVDLGEVVLRCNLYNYFLAKSVDIN